MNFTNNLYNNLLLKLLKHDKFKLFYLKIFKRILKLRFKILKKPCIPNLDFQITTKCTLRCEQCSILIPYYPQENQYAETFESFKTRLDNLLKNVDCICKLLVLGGEPFLNKELANMIEYASKKKQIKFIETVTNSTILPDESLLTVYKKYRNKNHIAISDYTSNPKLRNLKIDELKQILDKYNIPFICNYYPWTFMGHVHKENRTKEELIRMKNNCYQQYCHGYYNGDLYLCSRIFGMRMSYDKQIGTSSDNTVSDYVEITSENCSQEIVKLFCKPYFDACDYCHIKPDKKIPCAVQCLQKNLSKI